LGSPHPVQYTLGICWSGLLLIGKAAAAASPVPAPLRAYSGCGGLADQ
jgi:hypothetical protein